MPSAATFKTDLHAELTGAAAVSALIGPRMYPGAAPDSPELPYLTYLSAGGSRQMLQGGQSEWREAVVQVDCWASTALAAEQLADAVVAALTAKEGTLGSGSTQAAWFRLDGDQGLHEDDTGLYRVSLDFATLYKN